MATVATISVNFAQYNATSFNAPGVIDRSINPSTLSQYCLGSSTPDFNYLGGFVKKTADTMSGYLTLPSTDPTLPDHASRKGYVDSRIDSLSSTVGDLGGDGFVKIKGSTMTGPLTLNTLTQTLALHATSKSYVDTKVSDLNTTIGTNLTNNFLAKAGGTMSGIIDMGSQKITFLANPVVATDAANKTYVDKAVSDATTGGASIAYVNQQDALNVLKAGSTMSGPLILNADPTAALGATTKRYVDTGVTAAQAAAIAAQTTKVNKTGDTMSGPLILNADPTAALGATTKQYVDSAVGSGTAGGASIVYVNQQDALNVLKAGSTMSGPLYIAGSEGIIGSNSGGLGAHIDVQSKGSGPTSNAAYMTFHRPGEWAVKFGLDTDRKLKVGGWSMNTDAYEILNQSNWVTYIQPAINVASAAAATAQGTADTAKTTADAANTNANTRLPSTGGTIEGNLSLRGVSPTLYFQDTNERSAMIHCNSAKLYFLRGAGIDSTIWEPIAGRPWPLVLDLTNNEATFGGNITTANNITCNYLTLNGAIVDSLQAATKEYVDSTVGSGTAGGATVSYVDGKNALNVLKAGSTMSGPLILNADPTVPLGATTKQYVDAVKSTANTAVTNAAAAQSTANTAVTNAATAQSTANTAVANAATAQTNANNRVLKTGDTMSGHLTIQNGSPTLYLQDTDHQSAMIHCNNHLLYFLRGATNSTNWTQVNGQWPLYLNLTNNDAVFGGAITTVGNIACNALTLNADPTVPLGATTKQYVDAVKSTANTAVTNAAAAQSTANTAVTNAATAQTNANARVLKTGDTMSGNLIIRKSAPTIIFQDTDDLSSMIHCENNLLHFLRGAKDSTTWTQILGGWPLTLNLSTNDASFGGDIVALGDVTAFSDERIKENIKTIEEPLDKVLKMRGVSYNRRDEYGEKGRLHVGVIAQEIEKILPEVVSENDKGMKTVAYGNIVGVLIEAIKELNAKIEKLEAKN